MTCVGCRAAGTSPPLVRSLARVYQRNSILETSEVEEREKAGRE